MPFQVSPGINVSERDLTTVVPNVATTIGGIAGQYTWGPCNQRTRITTENELVETFGEPTDVTVNYFWTAANFLAYGNNLLVVRSIKDADALNSSVEPDGSIGSVNQRLIENNDDYETKTANIPALFYSKYPGVLGDSLEVLAIDKAGWDRAVIGRDASVAARNATPPTATPLQLQELKFLETFNSSPETSEDAAAAGGSNDELHVLVVDKGGLFTGIIGEVLETWEKVSKAVNAKRVDGSSNYVLNVLKNQSRYAHSGGVSGYTALKAVEVTAAGETLKAIVGSPKSSTFEDLNASTDTVIGGVLGGGNDGSDIEASDLTASNKGYSLFENPDIVDVTLLMAGGSSGILTSDANGNKTSNVIGSRVVDIAAARKDCVAFVSPSRDSVVGRTSNSDITAEIIVDKGQLGASNYGIMDGAWKYQYDRYRDVFIFVPMNGDMAGLCARTDFTNDAWWSPAGYNRGSIKNIVKASWEPRQGDRDELYKVSVNPLVTQIGAGVILYGDKTMQVNPTAFDRINVRRLFIVLEKAISIAARAMLFEFNDEFTRAQFVNIVTPFLREVQGRRGITDFKVVCDRSNNTGQVIDTNNFVGDIFIKPTRSINFIQLNFIAARSDVSFSEIGG